MSSSNILFTFVLLLGPLITVTSSNWIICWVGLELTFLGLIPLMFMGKYFSLSKEAILKYFCIQSLSSALMFLSGILILFDYSELFTLLFLFSVCLKLGMFPGHFWVPSVISGVDWYSCLLLLSWQKIPTLALLLIFLQVSSLNVSCFTLILGGLSALVGGLIGNNVNNTRSMIGASSISHTGWVVIGANMSFMWAYFILYSLVLILGLSFLWSYHHLSSVSILSMSGLPPFIMFIGKWGVMSGAISNLISMKFLLLPIMGALLSLMFYLKFTYSFYLNEWKKDGLVKGSPLILLNFLGVLYLVMFFGGRV